MVKYYSPLEDYDDKPSTFLQNNKIARSLVMKAVENLNGKRITFLTGDAGPLALATVFYLIEENQTEAILMIKKLIKLQKVASKSSPDEILYGWSGYVYALMFINEYSSQNIIPEAEIISIIQKIFLSGVRLAKSRKIKHPPMLWEWHDKTYLGAAHGVAGILFMMLKNAASFTESDKKDFIKPTLEWLITMQYKSGNFMSSEGSQEDRLVQWCHGAPGFTSLLILASEVFQDENYMKLALSTGDITWNYGLLKKGYSLCHGVSGNAYSFLQLYSKTKDVKHLHRAAAFMDWCLTYPKFEGLQPDRPYSLFEGIAGLHYFLVDMENPETAKFPGFDL